MFDKILLATDGSPDSKEALNYARDLAACHDAEVIVVHAFEPLPPYLEESWRDEVVARHRAEGESIVNQAVKALQEAGVETVTEIREGPPADAILRVAEAHRPDLIVMGSRGRGELASLLLGSVSHRVLAHAKTAVMITRAED